MNFTRRLAISYYKTIAVINEPHQVYLVQHQETQKIYIKKVLDVYNLAIYEYLFHNPMDGIPKIIDYCEEDGQLTVIEEYISGCSLSEKMTSRDLTSDYISHYIYDLCCILEKLHNLNPPVIHRDIKPSNIIITSYNKVILLDFNAAKHFSADSAEDTVLLGTQGYAAPEQYGFGSSSPQTDIYSVGILLRELQASLTTPTKIFDEIIIKCTQMNPSDRYKNVTELKNAISRILNPDKPPAKETKNYSYFPPGFRTITPWKMLVATPAYMLLFYICLSMEVENTTGLLLWLNRIICLLMMLSFIFIGFNYRDIQKYFPLCKSKNRLFHYLGIVLFDLLVALILMFLLVIIETVFSP
ncbi:MAG: serine/threonine protein kinase [Roseburia sp.]